MNYDAAERLTLARVTGAETEIVTLTVAGGTDVFRKNGEESQPPCAVGAFRGRLKGADI